MRKKLWSFLFSEEYIAIAILRLVEMEKAVVEGKWSFFSADWIWRFSDAQELVRRVLQLSYKGYYRN